MADVNTAGEPKGFIFGEKMEDRVIKPAAESSEADSTNSGDAETSKGAEATSGVSDNTVSSTDSGTEQNQPQPAGQPSSGLLRSSAFRPSSSNGSGILAPSRLGNPFVARAAAPQPNHTASPKDGGRTVNPFARTGGQDAEEEKREKPIVAPPHFTVSHNPAQGSMFGQGRIMFGQPPGTSLSASKFALKPSALDKQAASLHNEPESTGPTKSKTSNEEDVAPDDAAAGSSDTKAVESEDQGNADSTRNDNSGIKFQFGKSSEVPLPASLPEAASAGGSAGFVFGQNLRDRAVANPVTVPEDVPPGSTNGDATADSTEAASEDKPESWSTEGPSLAESAAAQEAKLARPDFQEVEVKTGEEDESNVFQCNVKLFVFNKTTQSWLERGRGQLRLNDMCESNNQEFQSRLVMRTHGSLRLVLNTKIWPDMLAELASEKTIRITAVDGTDGIKIFLILASRGDAAHIYSAISSRIQQLKSRDDTPASQSQDTPLDLHNSGASSDSSQLPHKRTSDGEPTDEERPAKRPKMTRNHVTDLANRDQVRDVPDESNDSSAVDPETEASNESFASSPTIKSSSSEA